MTSYAIPVSQLDTDSRATFIMRTYIHLMGSILAFAGIEFVLFSSGLAQPMAQAMLSVNWLLVLGAFVIAGTFASRAAFTAETKGAQYGALAAYIVVEAIIFVPLLYMASIYTQDPNVIGKAAWVTLIGFAVLTAIVFTTRKDFSFLGGMLKWGGILAIVAIVGAVVFSFDLGMWFSVAMVAYAGAAILYNTSKVMNDFPEDRYVAASLQLFASVALMFWYVLSIFMSRD